MANQLTNSTKTLTVAAGATTSNAVEVEDYPTYGLAIPPITTGTVTVEGSMDGTTFYSIFDEFSNPVLTFPSGVGSSMIGARAMDHVRGLQKIRVVCGAVQALDRVFTLYMRGK